MSFLTVLIAFGCKCRGMGLKALQKMLDALVLLVGAR
jgi:hypothetical protein